MFVDIDKKVFQHAKNVAADRNVNMWEVVEAALRAGLPPDPGAERADQYEQTALIELPEQKAS
ncbi:hypothetical protein [Nocardia salmonicida]|uniref:hypothetical protein n=1 Tax=Nocardia salmonicida TaxID=53431 RepID=UPI0037BD499D